MCHWTSAAGALSNPGSQGETVCRQSRIGVNRVAAAWANFEVQVRAGHVARGADGADLLPW